MVNVALICDWRNDTKEREERGKREVKRSACIFIFPLPLFPPTVRALYLRVHVGLSADGCTPNEHAREHKTSTAKCVRVRNLLCVSFPFTVAFECTFAWRDANWYWRRRVPPTSRPSLPHLQSPSCAHSFPLLQKSLSPSYLRSPFHASRDQRYIHDRPRVDAHDRRCSHTGTCWSVALHPKALRCI